MLEHQTLIKFKKLNFFFIKLNVLRISITLLFNLKYSNDGRVKYTRFTAGSYIILCARGRRYLKINLKIETHADDLIVIILHIT